MNEIRETTNADGYQAIPCFAGDIASVLPEAEVPFGSMTA
jgi:hypothetical protein